MGRIRVEFVPIQTFNLGFFGLDHLQLVYEDELTDRQDFWYLLEGVIDPSSGGPILGGAGTNGRTTLAEANLATRSDLIAKIGTPESRGSRIIVSGEGALATWDTLAAYAREIDQQNLPYIAAGLPFTATPTINSNSFIVTLLDVAGIDVASALPFSVSLTPGTTTRLGTTGNDTLSATAQFSTILSGFGDDVLSGTNTNLQNDKLYGGAGADTFIWSSGENILHGGQPRLAYASDGFDTVDYSGAGIVYISAPGNAIEHKKADFIATFATGFDQLFSIEQVAFTRGSDIISAGPGVDLIERPLKIRFDGEDGGAGDVFDLSGATGALFVNAYEDYTIVQAASHAGSDAGFWAQSTEWLIGGQFNDTIYASPTLRGVDGGAGNDMIDGRLATAFAGTSPLGYDIELSGGAGDDTIVSGGGRTFAAGGDGNDTFILSAMTAIDGTEVEFVIDNADANDRLLVAYDFFAAPRGDFDGSSLMQLRGAPFAIDQNNPFSIFAWGPLDDDEYAGYIDFAGLIVYERDGADLIINVLQGEVEDFTDPDGFTSRIIAADGRTLTTVRVTNWDDGELGITFPLTFDFNTLVNAGGFNEYPGFLDTIQDQVGDGPVIPPLAPRPDGHLPGELRDNGPGEPPRPEQLIGTTGDDVIVATALTSEISGGAGSDALTGGASADVLDGGSGNDVLTGGSGNDTYVIDSAADIVIETANGGFDRVIATVGYALGDGLENLELTGSATSGTGNALRNTIEGGGGNDTLSGLDGDDTLSGDQGDDILTGGAGYDGYVYAPGDGNDVIIDGAAGGVYEGRSAGRLFFTTGIASSDIAIVQRSNGDVAVLVPDGSVTLQGFAAGAGIDAIEFADGTVLLREEIAALAAAAAADDNTAPVAADDYYIAVGTGTYIIPRALLIANDSDIDGDALTIVAVTNLSHGSALINAAGDIEFTPGSAAANSVTFTYILSDGNGSITTARAEFALIENAAPVALPPGLLSLAAGATAGGAISAIDPDGDTLAYAIPQDLGPSQGSVVLAEDGSYTYTAASTSAGNDAFTVRIIDGFGGVAEVTVSITITGTAAGLTVAGTNADETLTGSDGDDTFLLNRNGGTDTYLGAGGNDIIRGGANNDTLRVLTNLTNLSSIEAINLGGGTNDRVLLSAGDDVADFSAIGLAGIELISGHGGNDTIIGSAEADRIAGGAGDDALAGGDGDDVFLVRGNSGLDSYDGGAGNDALLGSDIDDVVRVNSTAARFVSLEVIDLGLGANNRIVGTSGDDTIDLSGLSVVNVAAIEGGAGDDVIIGTSTGDRIAGGAGDDTLAGGDGDDVFFVTGNSGFDTYNGGLGFDILLGSTGNDTFRIANSLANIVDVERIDGGEGTDDRLAAGADNDRVDLSTVELIGIESVRLGGGDDIVTASLTADVLYGGGGRDTFVFIAGTGSDVVADFNVGKVGRPPVDLIDVSDFGYATTTEVLAVITDTADGAVLSLGGGDSVTFAGVSVVSLRGDHFIV